MPSPPRGTVFFPDPLTSSGDPHLSWDAPDATLEAQCVEVALARLDAPAAGGYQLRGRYVRTTTRRPLPDGPPSSVDGDFRYGVREPGFLFVMAYYWLDSLLALLDGLGVDGLGAAFLRPLWVDPLGPEGVSNSHFSPAHPDGPRLVLGQGPVPDATDPAVLAHECGHALHHHLFGAHGVTPWEEGFNDLLAACWLDRFNPAGHARAEVFPWSNGPATRWDDWRRVDVTERFDDPDYGDYDHYLRGSIWASTLWDGYLALGGASGSAARRETAADTLLSGYLDTLARLGPDRTAPELAQGLVAQAPAHYRSSLRVVFEDRGLNQLQL